MARLVVCPRLARNIGISYAALWALTLAVAFTVAIFGGLGHSIRGALAIPFDGSTLPRDLQAAAHLWWRNVAVCSSPLLLAWLVAPSARIGRMLGRLAVAAYAALNVAVVGAALGGYGAPQAAWRGLVAVGHLSVTITSVRPLDCGLTWTVPVAPA